MTFRMGGKTLPNTWSAYNETKRTYLFALNGADSCTPLLHVTVNDNKNSGVTFMVEPQAISRTAISRINYILEYFKYTWIIGTEKGNPVLKNKKTKQKLPYQKMMKISGSKRNTVMIPMED